MHFCGNIFHDFLYYLAYALASVPLLGLGLKRLHFWWHKKFHLAAHKHEHQQEQCEVSACEEANLLPTEEALRAELEDMALTSPSVDFHMASGTHIFFVPWLGPFGAKGFGEFPDEALQSLRESVQDILNNSTREDLLLWKTRSQASEPAIVLESLTSPSELFSKKVNSWFVKFPSFEDRRSFLKIVEEKYPQVMERIHQAEFLPELLILGITNSEVDELKSFVNMAVWSLDELYTPCDEGCTHHK